MLLEAVRRSVVESNDVVVLVDVIAEVRAEERTGRGHDPACLEGFAE